MCDTCGCGDSEVVAVDVQRNILSENERRAEHNREHFGSAQTLAVNLMGSPGSGKTAVLEATARAGMDRWRLGALAGDLATDNDARRLAAAGIPARSITTGSTCHLDAEMVHTAMGQLPAEGLDILFIENVGNLVCPAVYDLGQAVNVVVLSVTEGEDKPLKYPVMFRTADLVLLSKVDLLPHLNVVAQAFQTSVRQVMPSPRVLPFSAVTGEGIPEWMAWLESCLAGPRLHQGAPGHFRRQGDSLL